MSRQKCAGKRTAHSSHSDSDPCPLPNAGSKGTDSRDKVSTRLKNRKKEKNPKFIYFSGSFGVRKGTLEKGEKESRKEGKHVIRI